MLLFTRVIRILAGVLLAGALACPARAQTCFFADDYSNPARWTQFSTGITIANGGVQVTNTGGNSFDPIGQRGVFQALPQPLPDGGGWRMELDLDYRVPGSSGGLLVMAVAAGNQHPLNVYPLAHTPQDFVGIINTGTLGADPNQLPLGIIFSDGGTWYGSDTLTLRKNVVRYLRLERLNSGMFRFSSFTDSAHTQHQNGSPICYIPPGQYTGLRTVWHANLPQGSPDRDDDATLDNLCLSTIPVLDTTFTASVSRTRICLGQSLTLNAPNPDYDPVVWSTTTPGGASWAGSGPSLTYTPPVAGTYVFTANGTLTRFCDIPRLRPTTVEVVPPDVAAVSYAQATFCRTGTAAVASFAPAGGTFSGSAGLVINATTGLINLAASTPGAHTVSYVSTGFCPATATFSITITPLDVTSVAYARNAFCRAGSTAVPTVAPAGGTFTGTPGLVLDAATGVVNLAASAPGAHVITYTSAGPCPTAATFALRIDPLDVAMLAYAAPVFCATGTTSPPTISPVGGTFSSTAGLVINAVTGIVNLAASAPGPHTVTYTSAGFCPASATFALTINPVNVASVTYPQNTFCQVGSTTAPTSSPAGGTFTATPGLVLNAATGVIDLAASVPGVHSVTYTSAGPCPTTATFALRIDPLEVASLTYAAPTFCRTGFAGPLIVTPLGGRFSSTAGLSLNPANGVVNLATSTPGSYTITYTSAGLCPTSATFALTINPVTLTTLTYPQLSYCQDVPPSVPTFSPAGGTFSAWPGLALNPVTGAIDPAASAQGHYTVTYTSAGLCPTSATFNVSVFYFDAVAVSYAQATYCRLDSTTAPVVTPAGGSFSGSPGLVLNAETGVVNLAASSAGAHTVTYNSAGAGRPCPATASFPLVINALDVASLSYPAATVCQNDPLLLPTFGPAGGQFSGTAGLTIDAVAGTIDPRNSTPGGHTVTYVSAGPCPATTTFRLIIAPLRVAAIQLPDTAYCQAGTATASVLPPGGQLSGTAGLVFDPQTGTIDLARTPVGSYRLTYALPGPCAVPATRALRIRPRGTAAVTYADSLFCPAGSSPMPATQPAGGGIFTGTPGLVVDERTGVVDLGASSQGPHTVTFTAADRCFDPATARLTVGAPLEPVFYNIITPNGDGLNETFGLPTPPPTVSAYELTIFNRWGARVYRSTDPAALWAAADVAAGTYFYHFRFADCAGRARRYKGVVEVVK